MNVYNVGVVGTGLATQNLHLPVISNMGNVILVWLADIDEVNGRMVADSYGVDFISLKDGVEALPDCDVVLLSIPLAPRADYFRHFASRGIAVFAEKPFAINYADHIAFQTLFNEYSAGCGYQRRFFAPNLMFRKIVLEDWFGKLKQISINVGARTTKTSFDSTYQDLPTTEGGGALVNMGCHLIDLGFFIASASDYEIQGYEVEYDGQTDRKASGSVNLVSSADSADGSRFSFCVSWLDDQSNTVELDFEKIKLVAPFSASNQIRIYREGSEVSDAVIEPNKGFGATTSNQAVYLQWKEFLEGMDNRSQSMIASATTELTAKLIDEILHVK